ncbi:hypothetical protein [Burkholderia gladioli]|uniref:hypothetical protein n=1 Tax=Burkholderia gladioli TaxID=28095 RepID=UPI0016422170|nr:hypothetical protein [Burkholderia gladioli]
MVVAVITVWMMQVAIDEIVNVIAMRHRFVAATRPVNMPRFMTTTLVVGRAALRIDAADLDHVLVNMVPMGMMQVPIMQIINVVTVLNPRVTAIWAMYMGMVAEMLMSTGCHGSLLVKNRKTYKSDYKP